MPSLIAHSMKLFSRMFIRTTPKSPADLVAHLRRTMNSPLMPVMLPSGVKAEDWHAGALRGDRLRVASPAKVILYLHGGGYVCGKTRTYFNLCGRLASELNAEVLLPDYRLAPEHPFPAAIDDAVASYEWLLQQGWRPEQITIAGDSAGGGLTLGTLLALRDRGRPMPRCAVLISPFADVRAIAPSIRGNDESDYMLGAAMLEVGRNLYAQTPVDSTHPYASPVLGDFTGLPPLFITVCDHECLRDDAYGVEARALAAGVPVTLVSRPELMHVWPVFVPLLPEANEDLTRIANFIRGARPSARIIPLTPNTPLQAPPTRAPEKAAANEPAASATAGRARGSAKKAADAPSTKTAPAAASATRDDKRKGGDNAGAAATDNSSVAKKGKARSANSAADQAGTTPVGNGKKSPTAKTTSTPLKPRSLAKPERQKKAR
ncbi:MAG TPA: alpha/beta hydrolase fold domain-containing protein [Moraxellaceae bacterium]|nr:alpha/beta hydrolase fold domain-containing protein [Moraxellaceae bacterium]